MDETEKRRGKAVWTREKEYLHDIPSTVPLGKRLVHNRLSLAPELGKNGFIAWFAPPNAYTQMECNCYWVSFPHYRVRTREKVPPGLEKYYFRNEE